MKPRIIKSAVVSIAATIAFSSTLPAGTAETVLGRWTNGKDTLAFRREGVVIARPMGEPGNPGSPFTLKFRTEEDQVIVTDQTGEQLIHELRSGVLFGPNGERFERWDYTTVIFGFTVAADGSRRHIKIVRCEDPMDRHEVKGALAGKEKRSGVELMAKRKYPISKKDARKTKYDFLLFDNHTRMYLPPS